MNVILKGAVASSVIFLSASTTAALHWFVTPYIHKLKWKPGSDSFEVEMLSWLATYIPRTIKFSDIRLPETQRPFVTFKANGQFYFVDADHCNNKALLAKLTPRKAVTRESAFKNLWSFDAEFPEVFLLVGEYWIMLYTFCMQWTFVATTCFLSRRNLFLGSWDNEIITIQVIYMDNILWFSHSYFVLVSHISKLFSSAIFRPQHCKILFPILFSTVDCMMVLSFSPILGWLTSHE